MFINAKLSFLVSCSKALTSNVFENGSANVPIHTFQGSQGKVDVRKFSDKMSVTTISQITAGPIGS